MSGDPLLAPLSALLNRQLSRSSLAGNAATQLHNRVLAMRLRNTGLTLYMHIVDGQVRMSREFENEPDAILETTPLGLADLAQGRSSPGRLAMSGDPVIAQQFELLLRHTRPDWEEEISTIVGDVAAHHIGNTVRSVLAFGQQAVRSFSLDTAEFLREESRDVAAPAEIDEFNRAVDQVAEQARQIEQRLQALAARLKP